MLHIELPHVNRTASCELRAAPRRVQLLFMRDPLPQDIADPLDHKADDAAEAALPWIQPEDLEYLPEQAPSPLSVLRRQHLLRFAATTGSACVDALANRAPSADNPAW